MRLPEISIRRPVLATVMNLLLVLVGLVAYDRLSVREYPNIDVPVVTVEVRYPGASAAIMETQVASILEDGLSGIEGIRAEVEALSEILPEGMEVNVPYDAAVFIEHSIEEVYKTIGEAVALVVFVIFLFLRSARATLIPLMTIPVSLIGAFMVMLVLGYTINTLTLLAMVLAIGLVVDDAIVGWRASTVTSRTA